MTCTFRVIFKGETISGVDRATALVAATKYLRATPEQMTQVFAGRVAVLAKGASQTLALHYIDELSHIGLIGRMEEENAASAVVAPIPSAPPAPPIEQPPAARRISTIERAHARHNETTVPIAVGESSRRDEPTIMVSHRKVGEIPCRACGEIQPVAVHCRRCGEYLDPGSVPTIVVPRNPREQSPRSPSESVHQDKTVAPAFGGLGGHHDTTVVIPRRKAGEIPCRACGEIQPVAIHCRRCGEYLDPGSVPTMVVPRNDIKSSLESLSTPRPSTIESAPQDKTAAPIAFGESSRHNEPTIVVPRRKNGEIACRACGEIQSVAVHCRRCGEYLDPGSVPTMLVPRNEIPTLIHGLAEAPPISTQDQVKAESVLDAGDPDIAAPKPRWAGRTKGIVFALALLIVTAIVVYRMVLQY